MPSNESRQLAHELLRQMRQGQWQAGDRLPSLVQLARQYGVTSGIARGAVNLLCRQGHARAEHGRGVFVCGSSQDHQDIALVVGTLGVDQIHQLIQGVRKGLSGSGYRLVLHVADADYMQEAQLLEQVARSHIAGILFAPPTHHAYAEALRRAVPKVPCLQASIYLESLEMDAVAVDGQALGEMAANYLLDKGHRRIGVVDSNSDAWTFRELRLGIDLAMRRVRQRFGSMPRASHRSDILDTRRPWRLAQQAATELLQNHQDLTAVIGVGSEAAVGALYAARALGRSVPDQLSIVATMNDLIANEVVDPPLSIVAMPMETIGVRAAHELLRRIEAGENHNSLGGKDRRLIQLSPQLIERQSVVDLSRTQEAEHAPVGYPFGRENSL